MIPKDLTSSFERDVFENILFNMSLKVRQCSTWYQKIDEYTFSTYVFQQPKGLQSGSKQNQMSEIDQFNMLPKSQDIEQNQH